MEEEWRRISGFETNYMISNYGRLKSIDRDIYAVRNGKKIMLKHIHERIIPYFVDRDGYAKHNLYDRENKRGTTAHRLVMETFGEPNLKGLQINHKDGDKLNNCITNLEWCTSKENINHAIIMGLRPDRFGEKAPNVKMKEADIIAIREMYKNGVMQIDIARIYNLSIPYVSDIVTRKSWSHTPDEDNELKFE